MTRRRPDISALNTFFLSSLGASKSLVDVLCSPSGSYVFPGPRDRQFAPLLNDDYVIIGDVNGHNLWSMGTADARGDVFAEEVDERNFVVHSVKLTEIKEFRNFSELFGTFRNPILKKHIYIHQRLIILFRDS